MKKKEILSHFVVYHQVSPILPKHYLQNSVFYIFNRVSFLHPNTTQSNLLIKHIFRLFEWALSHHTFFFHIVLPWTAYYFHVLFSYKIFQSRVMYFPPYFRSFFLFHVFLLALFSNMQQKLWSYCFFSTTSPFHFLNFSTSLTTYQSYKNWTTNYTKNLHSCSHSKKSCRTNTKSTILYIFKFIVCNKNRLFPLGALMVFWIRKCDLHRFFSEEKIHFYTFSRTDSRYVYIYKFSCSYRSSLPFASVL